MNLPSHTRGSYQRNHLLQTPDTFVRAAFPGLRGAMAIVHAAPAMGTKFTAYTVEFEAGGILESGLAQSFFYVIEGRVETAEGREFVSGSYFYYPPGSDFRLTASAGARVFVIEKPFVGGGAPEIFSGQERDLAPQPLEGDSALEVRSLTPALAAYDFAVNTMTFQPGAQLPRVEIHVMEHALLMLEGEGIYRLSDNWYPTKAGDFIWMAPYCPQWFGALGKTPAKYLIYKDWNRHPLTL